MQILSKYLILSLLLMAFYPCQSQFSPPAGQIGTDAIHADSSILIGWAVGCVLQPGYVQAGNPQSGLASFGLPENAIGKANNIPVSLGDSGHAIVTFAYPLRNGAGPDFAVFENSFSDDFLELAFVEVSSNGQDYFRFPSVSLTQTEIQIGTFGMLDATKLNLLAGKYRAFYGVPFDLEIMKDIQGLNVDSVTHVRIIDVVGSIDPAIGSRDSGGRLINDPWPTPFPSSGFDLDAVGVIHDRRNLSLERTPKVSWEVFPNPFNEMLHIQILDISTEWQIRLMNAQGKQWASDDVRNGSARLEVRSIPSGLYIIEIRNADQVLRRKLIKE